MRADDAGPEFSLRGQQVKQARSSCAWVCQVDVVEVGTSSQVGEQALVSQLWGC